MAMAARAATHIMMCFISLPFLYFAKVYKLMKNMTSLEEEKLDEVRKIGFHYSGVKLSEAKIIIFYEKHTSL